MVRIAHRFSARAGTLAGSPMGSYRPASLGVGRVVEGAVGGGQAFLDAGAKRALSQVTRDTLANQERHRTQVEDFVAVGKRQDRSANRRRTDYANAKLKLLTAENDYHCQAVLNQAMGGEEEADHDVADTALMALREKMLRLPCCLLKHWRLVRSRGGRTPQVRARELSLSAAYSSYAPQLSLQGALTPIKGWTCAIYHGTGVPVCSCRCRVSRWGCRRRTWTTRGQQDVARRFRRTGYLRDQVRLDVEQARLSVRAGEERVAPRSRGSMRNSFRPSRRVAMRRELAP